jgi:hypothetical protein
MEVTHKEIVTDTLDGGHIKHLLQLKDSYGIIQLVHNAKIKKRGEQY